MMDEVQRYHEMVDDIADRSGFTPERIRVILYAGEPWLQQERFSAMLYRAFQYAEQTGADPAISLDAVVSLFKLEHERANGPHGREGKRDGLEPLAEKIERVSELTREPREEVEKVVQAMTAYFHGLANRTRRPRQKNGQ